MVSGRASLLFLWVALGACSGGGGSPASSNVPPPPPPPPPQTSSITLVTGGLIYTAANGVFAEAMAIDAGEIIRVGNNAEVMAFDEPGASLIELQGRLVLPGLHDSHVHILEAYSPLSRNCFMQSGQSPSALISSLRQCTATAALSDWIMGFGWDITSFLQSDENPLDAIDIAISDRPAAIMEETSHAVWVNSQALQVLGISAMTPDPPGGHIAKDSNGSPNGLLIDNAGDLAFEAGLARTPALDDATYQGLLFGLRRLSQNGITSFADARVYWTRGYHEFYSRAESAGRLTARVVLGMWAYPQMDDASQLTALRNFFSRSSSQLVQRSQVKLYVDGLTQNTTARTLVPYLVDYGFGTPMGLNYFDEDRLATYITELERVGYDFHIHAIGAGGVREALNAIERARDANPNVSDRRHRLTHVEHVHPDDIPRFAALGVIADIQLAGDFTDPEQFAIDSAAFIGANNPALPLPARALIDAGAIVTLSSDFDVSPLNPFQGIANAVTRSMDNLTVREAVDAYTTNAAYLMRHEERTGSLEVGKRADFIVLDRDIFTIPVTEIGATDVLLTVFDGNEVFRSSNF